MKQNASDDLVPSTKNSHFPTFQRSKEVRQDETTASRWYGLMMSPRLRFVGPCAACAKASRTEAQCRKSTVVDRKPPPVTPCAKRGEDDQMDRPRGNRVPPRSRYSPISRRSIQRMPPQSVRDGDTERVDNPANSRISDVLERVNPRRDPRTLIRVLIPRRP